ncbi:hypothetical protein LA080_012583 [Diaporthe eres]|nr:hypothetical protein LA080_012583 [Diaporthe eres]
MTVKPIQDIVRRENDAQRRQLTRLWREAKINELNFVGITMKSALVTGTFAGAIGWQTVGTLSPYVLAIWYGGLFLVLFSISLAIEQGIALHRLTTSDDALDHISKLLGYKGGTPAAIAASKPPRDRILAWQMPVMLLNISISLFAFGLMAEIFQQYRATHLDVQVEDLAAVLVGKKANDTIGPIKDLAPLMRGSRGTSWLTQPIMAGASKVILVPVAVVSILVLALDLSWL